MVEVFGYKVQKKDVIREFLSEEEIQKVYHVVFPAERLNLVRVVFIFSCLTGLGYVDLQKLKRPEIKILIDGEKWISTWSIYMRRLQK